MGDFNKVSRDVLHDYSFFSVVNDTIHESSLDVTFERKCVAHIGAVAVVPIMDNGDVVLIKQYRGTIDEMSLEAVAGRRDVDGEELEVCANRELAEEVAITSQEIISLGYIHTSPGFTDERIYLFLGKQCSELEENEPDGVEEKLAESIRVPLEQAVLWAKDGTISDGKSIINILRAADYLENETIYKS